MSFRPGPSNMSGADSLMQDELRNSSERGAITDALVADSARFQSAALKALATIPPLWKELAEGNKAMFEGMQSPPFAYAAANKAAMEGMRSPLLAYAAAEKAALKGVKLPFLATMEKWQQQSKLFQGEAWDLARRTGTLSEATRAFMAIAKLKIPELSEPFKGIYEWMGRDASRFADISKFTSLVVSPAVAEMQRSVSDLLKVREAMRDLSQESALQVLERMTADLYSAEEAANDNAASPSVDERAESAPRTLADIPSDPASLILLAFGQQKTVGKMLFLWMLLWFLGLWGAPIATETVKKWLHAEEATSRQVIHTEIKTDYGEDAAKRFKCVRAGKLKVRSDADRIGPVIEILPRGTPVEVLDTSGAWSNIKYFSIDSNLERVGWAASSYLSHHIC